MMVISPQTTEIGWEGQAAELPAECFDQLGIELDVACFFPGLLGQVLAHRPRQVGEIDDQPAHPVDRLAFAMEEVVQPVDQHAD